MTEPVNATDRRRGRTRQLLPAKAFVSHPVPELAPGRMAKVSIIIPCYNYARFLPDSIGSTLSQQGVEPEVIVVDDASTDDSAAVARAFAETDSRITLIQHKTNTNHVVAFNDGYAVASGEFIVRLDADDLLAPGSLARAVALFDRFQSVGLVYGHPRHFATADPPAPTSGDASWTVWDGAAWLGERCRRGYNAITTPEAVVRASVMKEIGPLSLRLRFAQDMEMWLRVAAVADVGRINGPDQALHRDHANSMSENAGHGKLLDLHERRLVFETLFDGPGGRLPDGRRMHDAAKRALAAEALEEVCRAYDRGRLKTVDVDDFVHFAKETFPDASQLPEWRAMTLRRRVGATMAPFLPNAYVRIARRRLAHESRRRQLAQLGL
ncbi:Glycosyl transferase family 2 [Micromonospora phaseoli]|uniref:Glycosyl transferase family 2 n=1 Tax=Micromonospora phaseoli TaxID=1144548 RepID=A0A1H6TA26_9ACTN|nr:glycosyltransferase family A protein [Micromonospora phaseoli]PZW04194.1 glycosyl transferase family 2 [Micromonospora phaseoli]GIJ79381.1 glycosyl transferase [Micromonospora phaseoli]SEI73947.1 Glycosyl transferase family 2 [Micromonospora phaseoli]